MKEGLIPSRYESLKCKKDMCLVERKGTIDGFEWRCRVQSKENSHFACRRVRKGTWFSDGRLSICVILRLTRKSQRIRAVMIVGMVFFHSLFGESGKILGEPTPLATNRKKRQATTRRRQENIAGYTRAFGDGPRNFEPWSSDVDDT
ncbi:uncharacterized protein TNCV_424261 [Trichonephila clavipes]|nr:uncharacterized protein TNCV_424261 [Trichonephila clavipes]